MLIKLLPYYKVILATKYDFKLPLTKKIESSIIFTRELHPALPHLPSKVQIRNRKNVTVPHVKVNYQIKFSL